MEEVWKDIIGFEGLYQFSNLYRIKSLPKEGSHKEYLQSCIDKQGYPRITLRKNGISHVRKIHRLVLEYYIGLCPEGMQCRHLNDKKNDYRIENLRWGTASENQQDSIRNGTHYVGDRRGTRTRNAKLTDEKILDIRKLRKQGLSFAEIARKFNVNGQTISNIEHGRTWSHIE